MRLDRIELREIRLRLREPFEISSGVRQDRRLLLVRVEGEGEVGWGECVAAEDPSYSYETTDTQWHVLTDFILPEVAGRKAEGPERVLDPVSWIRGHRMAGAGVEMAVWDLEAKLAGAPLAEHLGGRTGHVPVGVSVGIQPTDDDLFLRVEEYLERGYAKIKIKIKPGRDVEMLRGVRDRFGTEVPIMADANSAYDLADAGRLSELDDLELMMIEQPLAHDDYLDHARLQAELETPICLDESIRSARDATLALELGSCRIVNIKPGRVGGLASARAIHDLCRAREVGVWCGGMLESGVGRAHNLALATLPGFRYPGDISESARYWHEDVVEPEFELVNGGLRVPEGPGIGVRPRVERIESLTVRRAVFE